MTPAKFGVLGGVWGTEAPLTLHSWPSYVDRRRMLSSMYSIEGIQSFNDVSD